VEAVTTARAALVTLLVSGCGRIGFGVEAGPAGDAGDDDDAPGLVPIHQYHLDGKYDDDFGGPPLIGLGGSFVPGGYQLAPNQGLQLTGAMPGKVYTVDLVFSFDTLGGWKKILDFKNLGTDEGFYTYDANLQFVVVAGSVFETGAAPLSALTTIQVTLTRNDSDGVAGYVDRVKQFSFIDTAGVAALDPTDSNAYFFKDDAATGGGEASGGTVRRIRIYDVALSAAQIEP
jgi:hypothetical protein